MTTLGRTALLSLSAAIALGVVGVPGALAESSRSSSSSATSSLGLTYVVVNNDSLTRIASRVGVSIEELLTVNGFVRSSVIIPGQVIKLPDSAKIASPSAASSSSSSASSVSNSSAGLSYVVQRNDSLSLIASKARVSLTSLLSANNFTRTSVIVPGQVIALPVGAVVASSGSTSGTAINAANAVPTTPSKVQQVLDFARAQVGKPYVFGTAGPSTYDCSGLTKASYAIVGIKLPHQSLLQSKLGVVIDWRTTPIQAGDLVFTYSSKNPTQISHVGIAISSTQWIEAPNSGSVVRISALPSASRIQAVRRFI